jgi:tetratricopeptide (TPR) repeat protein
MNGRGKEDPLVVEIENELMPGQFFRRSEVSELTDGLERVQEQVQALVRSGEAARAVRLYEILLTGVYAKNEEADDECDLAMLFHRLACGWIQARQAAGRSAEETVGQLLNWMKNDNYGFCYEIEKDVIKVLDARGRELFTGHFQQLVHKAMPGPAAGGDKAIFDYENDVRLPAMSLQDIHESSGDVRSYAALCERLGFSPRDCERLAKMEMSRKHWAKALEWVEKGMALKPKRDWHNEDGYSLDELKPELLRHLGRKEDALALAWGDFQKNPNEFAYEQLMRYVPKGEKGAWRAQAMAAAGKADLGDFISLCVKTEEWERLAARVHSAKPAELETLSHYCTEPAAKGLAKRDMLAAAKLYRALALRIVNAGKSKYYREALDHFEKARDQYRAGGRPSEWEALLRTVRASHSRKSRFLSALEQIDSGKSRQAPSFAEQAQERWKRLSS